MDPVHLLADELDYELVIRGVYNLSTSRQKTTCLRALLLREAKGEATISNSELGLLKSKDELEICGRKLEDLIATIQQANFVAFNWMDCRSRLMHIIARIKRLIPSTPNGQSTTYQMVEAAEAQLHLFAQMPFSNQMVNQGDPAAQRHSTSPLADAIGIINSTRQRQSQSTSNLLDIPNQINTSTSRARSSLLTVRDFVPQDVAAGGADEVLLPIQFDRPPPPYSSQRLNSFRGGPIPQAATSNAAALRFGPTTDAFYNEIRQARSDAPSRRPASVLSASDHDFDGEFQYPQQRHNRKSVPVHQWKLSYSGDGHGLHLYDFLSELQMFQRSEGVTDEQLLSSVVHLLAGRARLWYRTWFDTFQNWNAMVAAMKTEFLPPKYDYKLLTNISNRRQKQSETFAEYLTSMRSLFKHLSTPINEQHKLCIIEENMLPKYAIATSVLNIETLDQLSNVCRRVDYAYSKTSSAVPFERSSDQRYAYRNNQNQSRSRALHAVEAMQQTADAMTLNFQGLIVGEQEEQPEHPPQQDYEQPQSSEVLEMRRGQNSGKHTQERRECFNCRRVGHSFVVCPAPRDGQFCFRCGSRNVTAFTCVNCAKNEQRGSEAPEGAPNPQGN